VTKGAEKQKTGNNYSAQININPGSDSFNKV